MSSWTEKQIMREQNTTPKSDFTRITPADKEAHIQFDKVANVASDIGPIGGAMPGFKAGTCNAVEVDDELYLAAYEAKAAGMLHIFKEEDMEEPGFGI